MDSQARYAASLALETARYQGCQQVHDLPRIFHYWSNSFIRPQLLKLGFSGPEEFFEQELLSACDGEGTKRILSLGSGNCDLEVRLADLLRNQNKADFLIECLDLNPAMLSRGRADAEKKGLAGNIQFTEVDLNTWSATREYDVVIANQSLHHILNLEGIFSEIESALRPGGKIVTSDMIGRNGHKRWPEALLVVNEFWAKLPPSYRINQQSGFYEESYVDRDYSSEGFEGIRAQDILPLLLERFNFRKFFGFANAINPFVDRAFGPNFDARAQWDRRFIRELHVRDCEAIAAGQLTPTQMLAVLTREKGELRANLSPQACVRLPTRKPLVGMRPGSRKLELGWPHEAARELEIIGGKLTELTAVATNAAESMEGLRAVINSVTEMKTQLQERTDWALRLEKEVQERTEWARKLEKESQESTAWAQRLNKELQERTDWALRLDKELQERTDWALRLDSEIRDLRLFVVKANDLSSQLKKERGRVNKLLKEIETLSKSPHRLLRQLWTVMWSRIRRRLAH